MGPIICVCTGNICRSPMAERLLKHALEAEAEPLKSIPVISAGVAAYDGNPASSYSVKALKDVGLDLSDHRSQMLTRKLIEEASVILVMTEMHKIAIEEEHGKVKPPVLLFRGFMPTERQVTDPFGSDYSTYKDCRDAIAEAVPSVVAYLKEQFGQKKD